MGEAGDPRVSRLLSVGREVLGLGGSATKLSGTELASVNAFLDDVNTEALLLSADKGRLGVANKVPKTLPGPSLVFYKTRREPVSAENYGEVVGVVSVAESPQSALLHTLRSVYEPSLVGGGGLEPGLAKLLSSLQQGLSAKVSGQAGQGGQASLAAVQSPLDELRAWEAGRDERSQRFAEILKGPVGVELARVAKGAGGIEEMSTALDALQDAADELWRADDVEPPYPENRMRHFLDVVGNETARFVGEKVGDLDVFGSAEGMEGLRQGRALCEQWSEAVEALTGQAWKRYPSHQWKGEPASLPYLKGFLGRIDEVMGVRAVVDSLTKLTGDSQVSDPKRSPAVTAFAGSNPLHYNPYTESQWQARLGSFDRAIQPLAARVIPELKSRLRDKELRGMGLLRELEKYRELLKRPWVSGQLAGEREGLLRQMREQLTEAKEEFRRRSASGDYPQGKHMADIVSGILWVRQTEARIETTVSLAAQLFPDLQGYEAFKKDSDEALEEMRTQRREQFDNWSRDVLGLLADGGRDGVGLQTAGKLMELEAKRGRLRVNYSDRLVRLLAEVRQLNGLGYQVPAKISQAANTAAKFYRHAILLKQVAHFYNTIDQQMLPSQQALMLDSALAFEKLVKSPKPGHNVPPDQTSAFNVTWDNPKELEDFLRKLQLAAQKLTTQNRRLRRAHQVIMDKVKGLMHLDLLREQNKWKEAMLAIREVFSELEREGFNPANMKPWKAHWDRQLYKALEHQYQRGLESLSSQIPPIAVDLVFKQKKLSFRPPLEEVQAKYFREMKKFLAIPYNFKGVHEAVQENSVFPVMVERNAERFEALYAKAEELFGRLRSVQANFGEWLVLAEVDPEALIEEHFKTADDWEAGFRLVKARGRAAEKLPNEIKVDCVNVNTGPVKSGIGEVLERLHDSLVFTLRHSVSSNLHHVSHFLNEAITTLASRPQNVAQVAEANAAHHGFKKEKPKLKPEMKQAEAKNRLLRTVAGQGVDTFAQMGQQWDKFELMLDSHQLMIREQVEVLKEGFSSKAQTFNNQMDKFAARWHQLKPKEKEMGTDRKKVVEAIEFLKDRRAAFEELSTEAAELKLEAERLEVPVPDFPLMEEVKTDLEAMESNWLLYEEFNGGLEELAKEDWISFRSKTYLFEEFLNGWSEKLKAGPPSHMSIRLGKDVEQMKELVPVLKYCRGEFLSPEHWVEVFRMLGLPRGTTLEKLTFGDLVSVAPAILTQQAALKELNARAQGEVTIRDAIRELELWGAAAVFTLADYQDSNGNTIQVIKDWKDVVNAVGDQQALLQSLKDSPYYHLFTDKAGIWETRLGDLDEFLHALNQIQRKWVYLEPIFGRGALPSEASRFSRVDSEFRGILLDVSRDPRLVSLSGRPGLRSTLNTLLDQLQRCQKALNQFLEEKRLAFPRFYFLGDDDLLEILGQSTNPTVIQSHLKKLFQGISQVQFDDDKKRIVGMISGDGEVVGLKKPVAVVPEVERWLEELSKEMKGTLRAELLECLKSSESDPSKFPSQVLCLSEQIRFTEEAEKAIQGGSLPGLLKELQGQLAAYTSVEPGPKLLQLKLNALVLDLVHHMDVVEQLMAAKTKSLHEWSWQKQLRFYLKPGEDRVLVRMVDAEFNYTYEYQGNGAKLVHTPLTDKCYLTLTQAQRMGLGGNPYGPAGTGKTESVKALGAQMGRQVLVFNCDEGIDVHSMGRIFTGIIKCGAWGCFDEFNRLDEAVLSAVSMQIQTIQDALKAKAKVCHLLGTAVDLDLNSGIFITLNPAGKGYGGRQKLPDNLKQLFRPVAMARPDNELIAETLLFAEGFKEAKVLGRKLVELFNLSRQLLSAQQHYDWGLRALKTVLRGCGDALHKARRAKAAGGEGAEGGDKAALSEPSIVVQALRLNTLSKLTFGDSRRFDALVKDVFPNLVLADITFPELSEALAASAAEMGVALSGGQEKKAFQLYEQLRQRMGVVMVGPSGSGKSILWRLLRQAMMKTGQEVKIYTINPKAIHRTKLLGEMDLDTREWSDGVLTQSAREVVKEPPEIQSWIICDGDVDPEWIESLNSVLDDNHLLTMPSGERIQFGSNVNFLFETHDLSSASPATVSRMGMIYLSEEDVAVEALLAAWLRTLDQDLREIMDAWLQEYFTKALHWVLDRKDFVVEQSLVGLVQSGLSHLRLSRSPLQFLVNLIRGLGSNMSEKGRGELATQLLSWGGSSPPDPRQPANIAYNAKTESLYSFTDDLSASIRLDQLKDRHLPVVNTASVQAHVGSFLPWLEEGTRQPFVLVGEAGSGKDCLLRSVFSRLRGTAVATLYCSAQTTPDHVLQKLAQSCVQVSANYGRVYRPKESEHLVLYLKDLNLPKPDKWGTCQLIAFLQQLLTYGGYYDANIEWVGLEGIQIVGSMSGVGNPGRHPLSPRFTSIVRICAISAPPSQELTSIFSAFLHPILDAKFPSNSSVWSSPAKASQLAGTCVNVYQALREKFKADDYGHYQFTPRHLASWVLGLNRYELAEGGDDRVLEVLAYEASRMFRDRLVTKDHQAEFDGILSTVLRSEWSLEAPDASLYYSTWAAPSGCSPGAPLPPFGKPLAKTSGQDVAAALAVAANRFSHDVRETSQLVFQEVSDLCTRVDRVLSQPQGSLLLAGRSGVGRRAAVGVMANMHGMTLITPKMTRDYTLKQFKAELKAGMQTAGIEGEQVVLLLEDFQLLEASFMELVNSLLAAGEVPGLYTSEELDPLLGPLRDEASQESHQGTMYSFFAKRVKRNLHVALVMDCSKADFSVNCDSNPAFYKDCTVVWMERWSRESLLWIPGALLPSHPKWPVQLEDGVGKELWQHLVAVFERCPAHLATPAKFVEMVETFALVYSVKKDGVAGKYQRLKGGVGKLKEAGELVAGLREKAGRSQAILAEKQGEADKALKEITRAMTSASGQKDEMTMLKGEAEKENTRIEEQKKVIEAQLTDVQPAIDEAKNAVKGIKSEALSEIRSLRAPPEVIRDILEAVLQFFGIFDSSFNAMRQFLAKSGIKDEIINFDAHRISPQARKSVAELVKKKAGSFDPVNAKRASQAAAPLASWVKANLAYAAILEKISPLESEKAKLLKNLSKQEKAMDKLSKGLQTVDEKVADLRADFEKSTKEATEIKLGLEKEEETLRVAAKLVDGLGTEFKRWNELMVVLEGSLSSLPRHSLLAAAFFTFLAGAPEDERRASLRTWAEMMGLEDFSLSTFLSSETEQLGWKTDGLPGDALSIENAVVLVNGGHTTPMVLDPSAQAIHWLKNHLKDAKVEVVNVADHNFTTQVELAVRFGKKLIVEGVEAVPAFLYPLLRRDLVNQGPRFVVQVGDKTVDYNEEFRLFLCTQKSGVELSPDGAATVRPVNFTTTRAGLASQLLGVAILAEKPELEQRKTSLLHQEEQMKMELDSLEQSLLTQLASSEGNILENKQLLESLNAAKEKSETINGSLEESLSLQEALSKDRNAYLPLADVGSALFFAVADLHGLSNMYRYNLPYFLRLFRRTLAQDKKEGESGEFRIKSLSDYLTKLTVRDVSRSLFKEDRLMFALHLLRVLRPDTMAEGEWELFVGTAVGDMGSEGTRTGGLPSWLGEERSPAVARLRSLFPSLYNTASLDDGNTWAAFSQSAECEKEVPELVASKTSPFQQLLLLQALRPDRLHSAMENFACGALRLQSVDPPPLELKKLLEETEEATPVLFLISPGADPSAELEELAKEVLGPDKYHQVPMGQGQQQLALDALKKAAQDGQWLCLQNLHLVIAWLPSLQKELSQLKPAKGFRLWLTTEVHGAFPSVLLESSLKVTVESPPGLKRNLGRSYGSWDAAEVEAGGVERARALFALAVFHAICQERRNFIPQGWTKFYEFNLGDLKAGFHVLHEAFQRPGGVQWDFVQGLMENAIYGGRVDNPFDIRVLKAYISDTFSGDVIAASGKGRRELAGSIALPDSNAKRDFVALISGLAESDNPRLFGLPLNITASWERSQAARVIAQLRQLGTAASASDKFDRQLWSAALTPILNLWKKLCQGSSLHSTNLADARKEMAANAESEGPLSAFLGQEWLGGVELVQRIHHSLAGLSRAIRGTAGLTAATKRLAGSLLSGETPAEWEKLWEGPEDPVEYLPAVVSRASALKDWLRNAEANSLLSQPLDLAQLFHPDTFLNALRQQTARELGQGMDGLKLVASWKDSFPHAAKVHQLLVEGATFDGSQLRDTAHNSAPFAAVPAVSLAWVAADVRDPYPPDASVHVPLYVGAQRDKVVVSLKVPCAPGQQNHWLITGVAFLLRS